MTEKKKFLLRIDADLYAALEKWAADDLRSINAQIEFLLTGSVDRANRNIKKAEEADNPPDQNQNQS